MSKFKIVEVEGRKLVAWTESGLVPLVSLVNRNPVQAGDVYGATPIEALAHLAKKLAHVLPEAAAILPPEAVVVVEKKAAPAKAEEKQDEGEPAEGAGEGASTKRSRTGR